MINHLPQANQVRYDNTGTGLTSGDVQESLTELDSRSIFLRKKVLENNFVVPTGYMALWVRTLEIADGVSLEIESGASMEIS